MTSYETSPLMYQSPVCINIHNHTHVVVLWWILIYTWNTKYAEQNHICWNDNILGPSDCRQMASYCTGITPTNHRRIRKLRAIFTCKACCKMNCMTVLVIRTIWKQKNKKSIRGALFLVSPALLRSAKNNVFVRYDICLRFDIISSAFF